MLAVIIDWIDPGYNPSSYLSVCGKAKGLIGRRISSARSPVLTYPLRDLLHGPAVIDERYVTPRRTNLFPWQNHMNNYQRKRESNPTRGKEVTVVITTVVMYVCMYVWAVGGGSSPWIADSEGLSGGRTSAKQVETNLSDVRCVIDWLSDWLVDWLIAVAAFPGARFRHAEWNLTTVKELNLVCHLYSALKTKELRHVRIWHKWRLAKHNSTIPKHNSNYKTV